MKSVATVIAASLVVAGCGTLPLAPTEAQSMSNYSLCRVLVKPLWSDQAKAQAALLLKERNEDCKAYFAIIAQQDANAISLIGIGSAVATTPRAYTPPPVVCTPIAGSVVCR